MDYVCKYCGKLKGAATDWLLGLEGNTKAMKGTVTVLGKWDETRADEVNTIRFCSHACQTNLDCQRERPAEYKTKPDASFLSISLASANASTSQVKGLDTSGHHLFYSKPRTFSVTAITALV